MFWKASPPRRETRSHDDGGRRASSGGHPRWVGAVRNGEITVAVGMAIEDNGGRVTVVLDRRATALTSLRDLRRRADARPRPLPAIYMDVVPADEPNWTSGSFFTVAAARDGGDRLYGGRGNQRHYEGGFRLFRGPARGSRRRGSPGCPFSPSSPTTQEAPRAAILARLPDFARHR